VKEDQRLKGRMSRINLFVKVARIPATPMSYAGDMLVYVMYEQFVPSAAFWAGLSIRINLF
jgi:hypothetical protein